MNDTIKLLIKNLIILLVNSKFDEIVERNENGRLSCVDIGNAINDYPGVISLPPDSAYDAACIYGVYDEEIEARKIEFDLWYDGQPSDLTLSADVRKNVHGNFVISIDDIHVM